MTEEIQLKGRSSTAATTSSSSAEQASRPSGIPDFRSVDGLYRQQWSDPPETILSHPTTNAIPKFFAFYRAKLLCPDAKPNAAHRKLAGGSARAS